MCEELEISRDSYYKWLKRKNIKNKYEINYDLLIPLIQYYYDLSNVISGSKTNILGFTALRTNLIYVAKNLSANIIKGIAKYNLLLRPFCNTWLVNMKIDNEDDCYYWWRPAKGYYNKHQCGGSSMKNGRVMACKWLSLKDISKLR